MGFPCRFRAIAAGETIPGFEASESSEVILSGALRLNMILQLKPRFTAICVLLPLVLCGHKATSAKSPPSLNDLVRSSDVLFAFFFGPKELESKLSVYFKCISPMTLSDPA